MYLHGGKCQKQICRMTKLSFGLLKEYFQAGIWNIEEKNVCTNEINFNEIQYAKVKFVFTKINGKEENVTKEEIKR